MSKTSETRNVGDPIHQTCMWCGRDFIPAGPRQMCCSRICQGNLNSSRNPSCVGKVRPATETPRAQCPVCRQWHDIEPRKLGAPARFCSAECRAEFLRINAKLYGERNRWVERICPNCGRRFEFVFKGANAFRCRCPNCEERREQYKLQGAKRKNSLSGLKCVNCGRAAKTRRNDILLCRECGGLEEWIADLHGRGELTPYERELRRKAERVSLRVESGFRGQGYGWGGVSPAPLTGWRNFSLEG